MEFKCDVTLIFEAINILEAKERLSGIKQAMSNYNLNIKISENERLFSEGDII